VDELFSNSHLKALRSNKNERNQRKMREEGGARFRNPISQAIHRQKKLRKDPARFPISHMHMFLHYGLECRQTTQTHASFTYMGIQGKTYNFEGKE